MRKFTALMMVLCACIVVQAQVPKSICVKSGISQANMLIEDGSTIHWDGSFYLGTNLEFLQHKYISILAEGGFVSKSDHFVYLSPMIKGRVEFGKFIPYVYVGPRLDFVVTTKSQRVGGSYDDYNFCVFGLSYGIGLEYYTGLFGFVAGFQQQYDITNVLNGDASSSGLGNWKHNTFIFSLGLKAYFGKKRDL